MHCNSYKIYITISNFKSDRPYGGCSVPAWAAAVAMRSVLLPIPAVLSQTFKNEICLICMTKLHFWSPLDLLGPGGKEKLR